MKDINELVLDAKYIHTGNSGVTLAVLRDAKRPTRAKLLIRNGSMGAFSTEMLVSGNDYECMSADQLRDIGLLFLESAAKLDQISAGKEVRYDDNSYNIVRNKPQAITLSNIRENLSKGLVDEIVDLLEEKFGDPNASIDDDNHNVKVENDGHSLLRKLGELNFEDADNESVDSAEKEAVEWRNKKKHIRSTIKDKQTYKEMKEFFKTFSLQDLVKRRLRTLTVGK